MKAVRSEKTSEVSATNAKATAGTPAESARMLFQPTVKNRSRFSSLTRCATAGPQVWHGYEGNRRHTILRRRQLSQLAPSCGVRMLADLCRCFVVDGLWAAAQHTVAALLATPLGHIGEEASDVFGIQGLDRDPFGTASPTDRSNGPPSSARTPNRPSMMASYRAF